MSQVKTWLAMIAAVLATGMAFIDTTALNVALNVIREDLTASHAQLLWTLNAYALALSAFLLAAGSFSDRLGHRFVFRLGTGLFAIFSLACGLAPTINWLIGFRTFQGLSAALMIPGSLILVCDVFPVEQRGKAIGIWTGCSVLMMTVGPIVGGILADQGWWRMIFFLNLPLSALVLGCLHFGSSGQPVEALDSSAERSHHWAIDWPGMLLAAAALFLVSLGFIQVVDHGWQPVYVVSILAGVLVTVVFYWHESRTPSPMLPLSLLMKRQVWVSCVMMLIIYSAFHAMLVFIPLRLIQIDRFSAVMAGVAQLPTLGCLILVSPIAGALFDRYGPKIPLALGSLAGAAGFVLLALLADGSSWWLRWFPGLTLLGIGLSFTITSLGTLLMNSVEADRMGIASSLNSAVSRLASVIGVAVLGGLGFAMLENRLHPDVRDFVEPEQIETVAYRAAFEQTFQTLAIVSALMLGSCLLLLLVLPTTAQRGQHR